MPLSISYDSRRPCQPIVEPGQSAHGCIFEALVLGYAADEVASGRMTLEEARAEVAGLREKYPHYFE